MSSVSQLIAAGDADAAIALCAKNGSDDWLPELSTLLAQASNVRTGINVQKCVAQIKTKKALMLLAEQFTYAGGAVAAPALIADPQAAAYPVLKKHHHDSLTQSDINPDYVLIAMAHMPVPKAERIADLKAALDASGDNNDRRNGAMMGLAYLNDPAGLRAVEGVLGGSSVDLKRQALDTLFRFPSLQEKNFAPLLVKRLNDTDAMEQVASDAEDESVRFAQARDWAAILLVKILKLKPSFSIEPIDWSKNGRHLTAAQIQEIKQKVTDLGYVISET